MSACQRRRASTSLVAFACAFASPAAAATVRLGDAGARIEVVGLPPAAVDAVRDAALKLDQWHSLFAVSVAGEGRAPAAPMLGKYAVVDGALAFTPRFPLRAGLDYRVVFDPTAFPNISHLGAKRIETTLALPKPPPHSAATVAAVYPSGDALPANLLKFYIHFSAPMTRGGSYRHIHIVDADGSEVPDAFLKLGEELWNAGGTRLTLLFDPGRIKRGLQPNEEMGAPLTEGRSYTLVIDADWPDAQRSPLAQEFRKSFRVTAPDYTQPNPRRWKITPPPPDTGKPLAVQFDEPLDHAIVLHALTIHDPTGKRLAGRVATAEHETQWKFHPEAPWQPGAYDLIVDPATEDRAGNSVGRPFETQGPSNPASDAPVILRFEIPRASPQIAPPPQF